MKIITFLILFSFTSLLGNTPYLDQADTVTIFLNQKKIGEWTEFSKPVHLKVKSGLSDTLKIFASTDWGGLDKATIKILDVNGQLIKTLAKTPHSRYDTHRGEYITDLKSIFKAKDNKIQIVISNMQGYKKIIPNRHIFNLTIEK